jgi:hypothetical protein
MFSNRIVVCIAALMLLFSIGALAGSTTVDPAGADALTAGIADTLMRSTDELKHMGEAACARVLELESIDAGAGKLTGHWQHAGART